MKELKAVEANDIPPLIGPKVESGEGIESRSVQFFRQRDGQVESGEGIERLDLFSKGLNSIDEKWNPVKELKDSRSSSNNFICSTWNPVKELKVCLFSVTHLLVRQRKWNPVKELKGHEPAPKSPDQMCQQVESGEGIERVSSQAPSACAEPPVESGEGIERCQDSRTVVPMDSLASRGIR